MGAGEVAGLLVLLGVVGVLAAIVGSGLEAGPVKFPSIPSSRQRPLAFASAVVIVVGAMWWVVQQQSGTTTPSSSVPARTGPVATGNLRLVLIPASSNIRVGDGLRVRAEVYNSLGDQLGSGECALVWNDAAGNWQDTTDCNATASEPPISKPGIHRIVVVAEGRSGLLATGRRSVEVSVSR